jgi:hypothetical protein
MARSQAAQLQDFGKGLIELRDFFHNQHSALMNEVGDLKAFKNKTEGALLLFKAIASVGGFSGVASLLVVIGG